MRLKALNSPLKAIQRRLGGRSTTEQGVIAMTEQEWLECSEPDPMLEFLRIGKTSERKLRLFACACVRKVWHLLPDEASKQAVESSELYADGEQTITQLENALSAASESFSSVASLWEYTDSNKQNPEIKAMQKKWDGSRQASRAVKLVAYPDIFNVLLACGYAVDA
jgi:hypothetical protein